MINQVSQLIQNKKLLIHRQFPPHVAARIPVSKNQSLSPVQIVAQSSKEMGYEHIPIAKMLDVKPDDVEEHLKVSVGDQVRMGSILAERKRLIGRSAKVTSPVEGTVGELINGTLYITRLPDDLNLRALIKGSLSHVIPGKGVAIQAYGSSFPVVWSNGSEGYGELAIIAKSSDSPLSSEDLSTHLYRKVIVVGHLADESLLTQLAEAEIAGLICGTCSATVFQRAKALEFPIVLTDGAGKGGMFEPIYRILSENIGNHTALYNGQYEIHKRPRVVMLNPDIEPTDAESPRRDADIQLKKGQTVRLLAGNLRGKKGVVQKVHAWPQLTQGGARHMGVDVTFDNGETVFVAAANLDIIL
ncbi:MAG: hypothetical protein AAF902_07880 [Chloroflexota bacterium]